MHEKYVVQEQALEVDKTDILHRNWEMWVFERVALDVAFRMWYILRWSTWNGRVIQKSGKSNWFEVDFKWRKKKYWSTSSSKA